MVAEPCSDDGPFYVESMIVIANGTTVLKADENPFYLKDRPVIAFPWDVIPDDSGVEVYVRRATTPRRLSTLR